jgi:SET domain-containing protein
MKDKLIFNNKLEMRRSPIHGWGVFAKENIKSGEILEECAFLIIPMSPGESSSIFIDYRFNFPKNDFKYQVIPFGFACIYNHSNVPNATWETDTENNIFIFLATKDIEKDEEIFTYYGGEEYWQDGRSHTHIF